MVQRDIFSEPEPESPERQRDIFDDLPPIAVEPYAPPQRGSVTRQIPQEAARPMDQGPFVTPPAPAPFTLGGEIPEARTYPVSHLPVAGGVGFEPQTREEMQGWEGPEPEGAQRFKRFMGESLLFPNLTENVEQQIRIAQDRPETGEGAIDPWEAMRLGAAGAPAAPYQFHTPGPIETGITLGTTDFVERMTEPANLALLAVIPFAFRIPAVAMMAQAGITVSILHHAVQVAPQIKEMWAQGRIEEATRLITEIGLEAPIAFFSGRGAFRTAKQRLIDPIRHVQRQRRMPDVRREGPEVDVRARPGEPAVEGAKPTDIVVEAEPSVIPEGPGMMRAPGREPPLPKEPPGRDIVPEDRLRGLLYEEGAPTIPRPPRRTPEEALRRRVKHELAWARGKAAEEQAAAAEAQVTPEVTPEGGVSVREIPDQDPITGKWGVYRGDELLRQFRTKAPADDFAAAQSKGLMTGARGGGKAITEKLPADLEAKLTGGVKKTDRVGDRVIVSEFFGEQREAIHKLWEEGEITEPQMMELVEQNEAAWLKEGKRVEELPPVEVTPPREDQTKVDVFEPEPDVSDLPSWRYEKVTLKEGDRWWVYQVKPDGSEIQVDSFKTEKKAQASIASHMESQKSLIEDRRKRAEPTVKPEGKVAKGDEPVVVGQVLLVPNKGYGKVTDLVGTQVRVEFDSGDASLVPADNAIMFRKAAEGGELGKRPEEFPERVGMKPEKKVTPEAPEPGATVAPKGTGKMKGLAPEGLSSGDTVWFKGKKKATIVGLSADGKKAVIHWDPMAGGGQRTVLMSNLTLESRVGPPKPEKKVVSLAAGESEKIDIGKAKVGEKPRHTIVRDEEGHIFGRVLSLGSATGISSKMKKIGKFGVPEARLTAYTDTREAFFREKLKTPMSVRSQSDVDRIKSEKWNELSEIMLKLDPDGPPRTEIVATESIDDGGLIYEYAIRPDLVEGKVGWVALMRKPGDQWENAGITRTPVFTASGYDQVVERIHNKLTTRPEGEVEWTDQYAQGLEKQRVEALDQKVVAEAKEKADVATKEKLDAETAVERAARSRTTFKVRAASTKPGFVAAVQHRKVLKRGQAIGKGNLTVVQDGIATSSDGVTTVMTRTDLPDGVYTPFVKGDNKALKRKGDFEGYNQGLMKDAPLPIGSSGEDGQFQLEGYQRDFRRALRVITDDETAYALNSAQIRAKGGKLILESTDGHRAVINTIPMGTGNTPKSGDWLISKAAMELILKQSPKDFPGLHVMLDPEAVTLIGADIAVTSKRGPGKFPKLDMVMPKPVSELVVDTAKLKAILKEGLSELGDDQVAVMFKQEAEGLMVWVQGESQLVEVEEEVTVYGTKHPKEGTTKTQKVKRQVSSEIPIGTLHYTAQKPKLTKSTSDITVLMPMRLESDVSDADFSMNLQYLLDVLDGVKSEGFAIGLAAEPGEQQFGLVGAPKSPGATTTGGTDLKKTRVMTPQGEKIVTKAPKAVTDLIKKMVKSDMASFGKQGEASKYAIKYVDYKTGARKTKPTTPPILQNENAAINLEHRIDKLWAQADPKGTAGAMAGREPALTDTQFMATWDAVRPLLRQEGLDEDALQKVFLDAWSKKETYLDERHLRDDLLGEERPTERARTRQEQYPESKRKYREKNLESIRAKARAKYKGRVAEGWEPGEPQVTPEGKQLKLELDVEDEALTAQAAMMKRMGEGAMVGRTDRPGPPQPPKGKPKKAKMIPGLKESGWELHEATNTMLPSFTGLEKRGELVSRFGLPNAAPRMGGREIFKTDRELFVDDAADGKPMAFWSSGVEGGAPPPSGTGDPPDPPGTTLADVEKITAGKIEPGKTLYERIKQMPLSFQRLVTSEFQPLKHAEDIIIKEQGLDQPLINMARRFEQQAGAHGKAAADVLYFEENITDPLGEYAADFNSYMFLKRVSQRLTANPKVKRVGKWSVELAERRIQELKSKIGDKPFKLIEDIALNEYQDVMDDALRLQVTSGRMTQERYDEIKAANDFYAPFKVLQVMDDFEGMPGTGRNIATTQAYTKAISGIDATDFVIGNILEESAKMVYRSRILAEKNEKMLRLDDLMLKGGKNNPFKKADPDRYYTIHYKPAEDILHQLGLQETQRGTGRQTLEQSFIKVGRALELADSVGLKLKKRNLRSALGKAQLGGVDIPPGRVHIMAFTSDVIAHELGHAFDVPLRDKQGRIITKQKKVFGQERDIISRLSTIINTRKGVKFGQRGHFQKELANLVKFTKLGGAPEYRAKAVERFAEFVNLYIHDPKQARALAPQWTDYFETQILPEQKIKHLVERLGAFFQKVDKLPNIMDQLKDMGGLTYIELAIKRAFPERQPQLGVRFGTQPRPGQDLIEYFKDGKRQALLVPKKIAQSVKGLHREEATMVARLVSQASMPMRLGATGANAAFQPVNLFLADLPISALVSRYGLRKPSDIYQFPMDFIYSAYTALFRGNFGTPNEQFIEYLKSGVANSTIQKAITPGVWDPIKVRDRSWAGSVLTALPRIASAIEETNKILGVRRGYRFEKIHEMPEGEAKEEAMRYVAAEIRNYGGSPDFLRRGLISTGGNLENVNLLVMFFNARVQGGASHIARLVGRTSSKGPEGEDRHEAAWAWGRMGTAVGIPALTLALWNFMPGNKEDYDKREQWEKDNYFLIPRFDAEGKPKMVINDNGESVRDYWRIPKRELVQLFGNTIESAVAFAYERDPEAVGDFAITFLENISPVAVGGENTQERIESVISGLNPFLKTPIEYGLGRDTFRHRLIMPTYIEGVPSRNLSPSKQYTRSTPQFFIDVGQATGISPLIIEQLTRGYTAGLITQFMPRKRPGRGKALELPLIGSVLSRYVGSEYLAQSEDPELEAALLEQGDTAVDVVRKAREIEEEYSATDPRPEDLRAFVSERGGGSDEWARVRRIIEERAMGLDSQERLIKTLGVMNGARARYIAKKAHPMMEGPRLEYLQNLRRKQILTREVIRQYNREIRRMDEPQVIPEQ